jgi:peptidoglycan hydrolase-like protein with peptidoglycan-binding domain
VVNLPRLTQNLSYIQPQFNDRAQVTTLQQALNHFESANLTVTGTFDTPTVNAVKAFQTKYRRQILDIWNLTEATGYVGITTRLKLNSLISGQTTTCPAFTEYNGGLTGVRQSPEIGRTQQILQELDMYQGPINNTWDSATNQALIRFQETFREVMLDPWNITEGTGYKYKTTNLFLNYFVGCETGAVELEGVGRWEL